ncbi:MAG: sulfotransferase family protein [Candidatus Thiodiazotropha lotti]|uniref:Sulfotransferase family protein n=1 Tax=Candidatus Thiodiazotropha lotti TaxID=2792787 RepID=A0A9E4K825_9GAMM|nr:sulfotransferase family protein [Candidatus Thiodiazotropha lotti]ODB98740.1 sulfotransferase [Candidatus Thiodiazotropha endoloripes]MCG7932301.1 sulfotransferase family protein [Candidatus Thiodiazotropha lotti]MCG7940553.1 sulfotransferase family protein [Candidatus Thiodiazotropha lotti]MCG7986644.1 sulfotransferase family protein [Candidatus Thiodiazotropha lotti]
MLLSIKYNFLFVHIAKTGGTSVRSALQPLRWRDPWYYPMFLCSRFSHLSGHRIGTKFPRHSRIVAAKELLPEDFFNNLFKFAIVRNPWDLQVSSYHHIRRERPHLISHIEDFDHFIRWKLDPERPYQYHVDTSIQSQLDYLIDLQGKILVDFIGHYENLAEDFKTITTQLKLDDISLPHKRRAKDRSKDYREYYTDDLAELVGNHFKRDIEAFGYHFDQAK